MISSSSKQRIRDNKDFKNLLLKAVAWNIIGSACSFLLLWLITSSATWALLFSVLEVVVKTVLYIIYEFVWGTTHLKRSRLQHAEKTKKENSSNLFHQTTNVSRQQREERNKNKSFTVWLSGLSGSGKSTIATHLESWFYENNYSAYVLDGDNTRLGINNDLTFSREDRGENIRRVAEICKLFNDAGIICIASFISPFEDDRTLAKKVIGEESFFEVFVDASLETCIKRDTKGLYKLAAEGKIKDFTGISSPFEAPTLPSVHLHTDNEPVAYCIQLLVSGLISDKKLITVKH